MYCKPMAALGTKAGFRLILENNQRFFFKFFFDHLSHHAGL
jgi:hypothetical protein